MKRTSRRVGLGAVIAALAVGIPTAAIALNDIGTTPVADSGSAAPGNAPVPSGYTGINDPALIACMQAKKVCNPAAIEPNALSTPGTGTPKINGADVALTAVRNSIAAPSLAPGSALSMTGSAAEQLTGQSRAATIDESRPVWVVTIHTPQMTDGGPAMAGTLKTVYSAIVDAATGQITDDCVGCDWVGSGN